MSKLLTWFLPAIAIIAIAAPATAATAAQQTSPPLSATLEVMTIGNPHSPSQHSATSEARQEERRRSEVAEWQNLLGTHQPHPAMGVGGHLR